MPRSIWKLPFSEISLLVLHREHKTRVWSRRSTILPQFVGRSFLVHNGKSFIPLRVAEDMIGHKFGEFATTRKKPAHKVNKKRQSRKK
jgi:small subunit ribosomal protein S19